MALLKRVLVGASGGVAFGVLMILVGLGRALVAVLTGTKVAPPSADDVRFVAHYVGSFSLAGALLAALWPLLRNKPLQYFGFVLAATIIGIGISAEDAGGLSRIDGTGWFVAVFIGFAMGLAAGYGFLRHDVKGAS